MAKQTLDLPLLRSVLRCDPQDAEIDLRENLDALRTEVTASGIDAHLLQWLGQHRDRTGVVADSVLARTYYTDLMAANDQYGFPGITRLNEIEQSGGAALDRSHFRYALDAFKETVISDGLGELLQQTARILQGGYTLPPVKGQPAKTYKGASDAQSYLRAGMDLLASRFQSETVEGSMRLDAAQLWADYEARKITPPKYIRSGFLDIDTPHGGLKAGDLALVLGFTGHYKSTFCLNWAYRAMVYQGLNVGIVPTEMLAKDLLEVLAVMHTYHPKFRAQPQFMMEEIQFDRWADGLLTTTQEDLMKAALDDLQTDPSYGQMVYMQPGSTLTVRDVRRWAEQQHRKLGLQLLVLDYMGQINPDVGGSAMKESALMNVMISEVKKMTNTFANGEGIAVLSPFQASREGFKEAEKNGGIYTLRAFSWANEAERSCDFAYSTYTNETMRIERQLQVGNLKARKRALIDHPFKVFCDPKTRVIEQLDASKYYQLKADTMQTTQAAPVV